MVGLDVDDGLILPIKSNETINNVGPLGLNLSFMISDDISAGLDVNYSKCSKTFEYLSLIVTIFIVLMVLEQ